MSQCRWLPSSPSSPSLSGAAWQEGRPRPIPLGRPWWPRKRHLPMKVLLLVLSFVFPVCAFVPALAEPQRDDVRAIRVPERSADDVCHRVSEGNLPRVYCGKAGQWSDLRARVGFRCRNEGRKDELCASAREWKRLELIESTQQAILEKSSRESYQATVDGNRQTATDMQAAGIRPVMPAQ